MITPTCPTCHSYNTIRKGRQSDRQRWRCKDCGLYFQSEYAAPAHPAAPTLTPDDYRTLYTQGHSIRAIAAQAQVSRTTVRKHLPPNPRP